MSKKKVTTEQKPSASAKPPAAPEATAAAEAPAAAASTADLEAQLAAAEQEIAEHKENYLRAAAELENIRRRSEKKITEAHQYALSDFTLAIGEVRDCLEAALESATAEQHEKMHEGVALTLRKLVAAMDARHILPIKPDIGVAFDPAIHMAIGKVPASAQAAADTVAVVVQAGYMLNGRVIRAASVMVATETPAAKEKAE